MLRRKTKPMQDDQMNTAAEEPLEITAGGPDDATYTTSTDAAENPAQAAAEAVTRMEFEQLRGERDQLVDRLARMQAEFDNARKRAEREKVEYRDYATGAVVEQFLPVLDNFALALAANGSAEQLRSGVLLIVKQMEDILRQLQVVPVATVGEPFDPRVHEALGTVERTDMPDQHVADEIRRGYKIRERLLRPAMVRVVSNPNQAAE
jgi:molecular chaperone GrpE